MSGPMMAMMAGSAAMGPIGAGIAASGQRSGLKAMRRVMDQEEQGHQDLDRRQRARLARYLGDLGGAGQQGMNAAAGAREGVDQTAQELAPLAQAMGSAQGMDPVMAQRLALATAGDSRMAAMQRALGLEADRQQLAGFEMGTDMNELRQERARRLAGLNDLLARAGQRGAGRRMLGQIIAGSAPAFGSMAGMYAGSQGGQPQAQAQPRKLESF